MVSAAVHVSASDTDAPLMHGASYSSPLPPLTAPPKQKRKKIVGWDAKITPDEIEQNIRSIQEIKRQGFPMVSRFFSFWGYPSVEKLFNWCDENSFPFVVMIQGCDYVHPRSMWNIEKYAEDPSSARIVRIGRSWANAIKGHPSVRGVILGNEVRPRIGRLESNPLFWNLIRADLKAQYKNNIGELNRNWSTQYTTFDEIGFPPPGSGGYHDLLQIARRHFIGYYDTLIRDGFKPVLRDSVFYCSKHSRPDPFTWRASKEISAASWDDIVAHFPLWVIKASADTTPLPLFNSELHLYHERYDYFGSGALSRYRYLTSALLGEYWTCNFGLVEWTGTKPEVAENHRQALNALQELQSSHQYFRALARAYQEADLNVLVTEENWYYKADERLQSTIRSKRRIISFAVNYEDTPFGEVYARMSVLGKPWRYYLENDLPYLAQGTLVIWSPALKLRTAQQLADLPGDVRLVFADAIAEKDPYGQPLPAPLIGKLRTRSEVRKMSDLQNAFEPSEIMHPDYQRVVNVSYPSWSGMRGGRYEFDVPYSQLEVRSAKTPEGHLTAIVNNTGEEARAVLPWADGGFTATDVISGESIAPEQARRERVFSPFEVKLYLLEAAR